MMFDALERTWRSTDQENLINELYQGRMKDYVKCLKVQSCFIALFHFIEQSLKSEDLPLYHFLLCMVKMREYSWFREYCLKKAVVLFI